MLPLNPCTLSGFPSHLHHTKRLLGYTKAGEESTLDGLCSSADLNQHCRLQDRGLERWGRSQGLAADRCFPTKAPSVSESKSLELQSHGLQTQQPIPGGGLASEVRPIWTTDRSLPDLRKWFSSQEPLPLLRRTVKMAMLSGLCAHHRSLRACVRVCICSCMWVHMCVGVKGQPWGSVLRCNPPCLLGLFPFVLQSLASLELVK